MTGFKPLLWLGVLLGTACSVGQAEFDDAPDFGIERAPRYQPLLIVPLPPAGASAGAAAAGTPLQSFVGNATPIGDALLTLFRDSDINLVIDPEVVGELTFDIKNTTVERAFESLLRSLDYTYRWEGDFLRVAATERARLDIDVLNANASAMMGGGGFDGGGGGGGAAGGQQAADDGDNLWDQLEEDVLQLVGDDGFALVNPVAGTIEIEARPSVVRDIRNYVRHTVDRVTNQVSLEARVLEVRLTDEFRFGVDWDLLPGFFNSGDTGLLPGGSILGQNAASGGTAFNFGLLKAGDFSVFVDALQDQGQVRVLSSPRVATLNNQPASIRVVDQIPVIEREIIDSEGGTRTQFDIRFVEAGISVFVTPQIGADGIVTCRITPSVVEQTGTVITPDGLQTEPILSTRATTTSVRVPDGESIVIGGLRNTRKSEDLSGIPLLMDIPWLGSLFSSTVQSREEVELIVMVVPRVLDDAWMEEELRRSVHRIVDLRRPFRPNSIQLETFRPEDWSGGSLQGAANVARGPGVRTVPAPLGDAPTTTSWTVTRRGLAGRLVERADDALRDGDRTRALALLDQAVELDRELVSAMVLSGILHARDGRLGDARSVLDRAIDTSPGDAFALTARGYVAVLAGSPFDALRHLRRAHDAAGDPTSANNLAAALLLAGDAAAAADLLRPFRDAPVAPPELFANLAAAELEIGDRAGAAAAYASALERGGDPNDPRLRTLAALLARARDEVVAEIER